MKKLFLISITSLISLILLSQAVISSYGKENKGQDEKNQSKSEVKIEVKNNKNRIEIKKENKVEIENEDENEIEEENENKNRVKIKIEEDKNKFKIWGPIQSFTPSSITIDQKTITIDPNTTGGFKQVGKLEVGMYAKVEGVIINGTFFAEKIVVDNRNKISQIPSATVSPTATSSSTPSVNPSESIAPTVSTNPSPTITGEENSEKEEKFILGEIIKALENFLNSLKEITHI